MKHLPAYSPRGNALPAILAVTLLFGCQSGTQSVQHGNIENARLAAENAELQEQLREYERELTRSEEMNSLLGEELVATKRALEQVERQFVSVERGLIRDETKASAVATIAEVRLLLDNLKTQKPFPLDSETLKEVESKLASANTLTRKRNYTAAVYYADRARRLLNQGERRHHALDSNLTVVVGLANLRRGPGSSFGVIARLDIGTAITRIGRSDRWFHVRTKSGREGWVHTSLVQ